MKDNKRSYFVANSGAYGMIIIATVFIVCLFHISITIQMGIVSSIFICIGYLIALYSIQLSCREVCFPEGKKNERI